MLWFIDRNFRDTGRSIRDNVMWVYMGLISPLLTHMIMFQKINDSIQRLYFICNHKHRFETPYIPIMICIVKLSLEFLVEYEQILGTFCNKFVLSMIMSFVSFVIIVDLGEFFYMT